MTNEVEVMDATEAVASLLRHATPTHLTLPEDLPEDEWAVIGALLAQIERSSRWWLGSWWLHGERNYGESVAQAAPTGYSVSTCQNAAWVCSRIESSRRRDSLTFEHHAEVAALPVEEQDEWLDKADEGQWTRSRLRENVRSVRVPDPEPPRPVEPEPVPVSELETAPVSYDTLTVERAIRWLLSVPDLDVSAMVADPHELELLAAWCHRNLAARGVDDPHAKCREHLASLQRMLDEARAA